MQIFSIYKATNKTNGKVYIGFDSNWPNRQNSHKNNSSNSNAPDYDLKFHRAIRKHGWSNFEWEVLYEHWDGQYLLNVIEPYFIDVFNSIENGYNISKGGEGCLGYKHTEEAKEKLRKPKTKEHKIKLSIAHKNKKQSEEHIKNRFKSKEKTNGKNWLLTDPKGNIYQIKNLKQFFRENKQYNIKNVSPFTRIANGELNHYKNWKCIRI